MKRIENQTATDIFRQIVSSHFIKDYTVIITGRTGPTGKTTLCKLLNNAGVRAIEISESLNYHVDYLDMYENEMIIDDENKIVLVVLNRRR